jgi:hypothetical protein
VVKRIVCLSGVLLLLVAALVFLWAHRFEPVPGSRSWQLDDLRGGAPVVAGAEWIEQDGKSALRLWVDERHPYVQLLVDIPGIKPCSMMHVRYRLVGADLIRGGLDWQTGRFLLEWHPPDGAAPEIDPIGSIEHNRSSSAGVMVAVSANGLAMPALRLENLAKRGDLIISDLRILPVRERMLWRIGGWILAAGFLGWIYVFIRQWPGISGWRPLAAALVWLAMGYVFVVPGPWKTQRPLMAGEFQLGETMQDEISLHSSDAAPDESQPSHREAGPQSPNAVSDLIASPSTGGDEQGAIPQQAEDEVSKNAHSSESGETGMIGKVLPQGALFLKIKLMFSKARIFLHVLLLLGPTLVSAWLIGRGPTLWIAILCAAAIELAQMAFGFRFDWFDLIDLVTDAIGIAAGLWLAARFRMPGFRRY